MRPLLYLACGVLLASAVSSSSAPAPGLRERALVDAYGTLARSSRSSKAVRAYDLLVAQAPVLLYDLNLQRAYWQATAKASRGQAAEVRSARQQIRNAGLGTSLESSRLRAAFRYFFQRLEMRQKLAPHIQAGQPYLDALGTETCVDELRLANAATSLFEIENGRSPGADGTEIVDVLRSTGYLPERTGCIADLGGCDYTRKTGFECAGVGSSEVPTKVDAADRAAMNRTAQGNPFVAALRKLAPPARGGKPFDASLRAAMAEDLAGDKAAALSHAVAARKGLPGMAGNVGLSLRFYETELLLRLRQFDEARAALVELRRVALAELPPRFDQVAACDGVLARVERAAGNWGAAMAAAQASDRSLVELFGEEDPRRVGALHSQAVAAKLTEKHDDTSSLLSRTIAILEDSGYGALVPSYQLMLGRSEAARGKFSESEEVLTSALGGVAGGEHPSTRYKVGAARYLRGVVLEMGKEKEKAAEDFAQAYAAIAATPLSTPDMSGLEPEVLAGFGSLCRVRRQFGDGRNYLSIARGYALEEGGEAHPVLARIDQELVRLNQDEKDVLDGKSRMMTRLEEVNKLLKAGRYKEAHEQAKWAKKDLAKVGGDRGLMGWLRFFQFQSLYKAGDISQAYTLLAGKEDQPYQIPDQNFGYMASVGMELALRLGKDAEELRGWGERCYDARVRSGDLGAAALCARNACQLLGLRDLEPEAAPFAEKLIELGTRARDATLVLDGVGFLALGRLREGDKRGSLKLMTRLDTVLAKMNLDKPQQELRKTLLKQMANGKSPPSHEQELKDFLEKKSE